MKKTRQTCPYIWEYCHRQPVLLFAHAKLICSKGLVFLSDFQYRRMEGLHIHCVWLHLCLQTEALTLVVNMSVLAFLINDEIACIELHARTIRNYIHRNTRCLIISRCDHSSAALGVIVGHIVVVVAASKLQLLEIGVNLVTNLLSLVKVHWSALYRRILTCRNGKFIHRSVILGMNGNICIQNLAAALSCKVKVRVVGHVGHGCLVADAAVINLDGIVLSQPGRGERISGRV